MTPLSVLNRMLRICGYTASYGFATLWYLLHGRTELVGDAIGEWGKAVTDTLLGKE
jgi:hypothetical protein